MFIIFYNNLLGRVMAAEHMAMPFGATAAVNNFNRLGRALLVLFVKLLGVSVSQYF